MHIWGYLGNIDGQIKDFTYCRLGMDSVFMLKNVLHFMTMELFIKIRR